MMIQLDEDKWISSEAVSIADQAIIFKLNEILNYLKTMDGDV